MAMADLPGHRSSAAVAPGEGPLFGAASAFRVEAIHSNLLAREGARVSAVLATIDDRGLESGWENPPFRLVLGELSPGQRAKLILSADFRRWTSRFLRATHPGAPPDAALPVHVQAVWNLIAMPWLLAAGDRPLRLWLMVYKDGTVPLPGSGLALTESGGGRRVRLTLADGELRFDAENGAPLARVVLTELLAAAAGTRAAMLPGPWRIAPRIAGIELTGPRAADDTRVDEVGRAIGTLAQVWPGGAALVHGHVQRIELETEPELHSKTVSELPGLVILGGWATGPAAVAELIVHEAAHLLVYEMERTAVGLLPDPEEMRRSPFSRAPARPAYMLLHGIVSFLAQAVTGARWPAEPVAAPSDLGARLDAELERLEAGMTELMAHLAAHDSPAHPFIAALQSELAILRQWRASAQQLP